MQIFYNTVVFISTATRCVKVVAAGLVVLDTIAKIKRTPALLLTAPSRCMRTPKRRLQPQVLERASLCLSHPERVCFVCGVTFDEKKTLVYVGCAWIYKCVW